MSPATLTIATFNCLHGLDLRDGRPEPVTSQSLDALADALAGLDADVIALQEVDRGLTRSGGVDQVAHLARRLGLHGVFGPSLIGDPDRAWVPAPADDPGGGAYGVGLLSRFPVLRRDRLRLPGGGAGERAAAARPAPGVGVAAPTPTAGPQSDGTGSGDGPGDDGGASLNPGWDREPRAALRADIAHPAGTVAVTTTHLSYLPWRSLRQLRAAARFASHACVGRRSSPTRTPRSTNTRVGDPGSADPGPGDDGIGDGRTGDGRVAPPRVCVLTGDLNLPARVAAAWLPAWRQCRAQPSYPADDPRLQVDQILLRGAATVMDSGTRAPLTSDHRPVISTLLLH